MDASDELIHFYLMLKSEEFTNVMLENVTFVMLL